ncbi:ENR1 protein, partial [Alopecoenas beccarii]|nr:ENR1 protein [Alopecoenas beccarii]
PLGTSNTTYFQTPWTPTGLFENGSRALKGHYWVCGQHTYKLLPANWTGVCYVGVIRPLFFLLPEGSDKNLDVRLYNGLSQSKRSVNTAIAGGSGQTWGKDDWPPQWIIQRYGSTTWNPSEVISSAREPVDDLNLIIWLQDALENVSNETTQALGLLADKAAQMRPAALQQRMVHNYLLAEEGGVCGKLNYSNCCVKIDDNGEIIKQITYRMRALAHVPVQTGKGWEFGALSWLPGALWVKCILVYVL